MASSHWQSKNSERKLKKTQRRRKVLDNGRTINRSLSQMNFFMKTISYFEPDEFPRSKAKRMSTQDYQPAPALIELIASEATLWSQF